jgi:hypothetical protein
MDSTPDLSILPDDLERIRAAVTIWKGPELGRAFSGTRVADYASAWSQFVDTDWAGWDRSEYDHDIGCRYWLQVILEHSAIPTRARLESAIRQSDQVFRTQMRPIARVPTWRVPVLGEHPYFWETHTIHPELWVT